MSIGSDLDISPIAARQVGGFSDVRFGGRIVSTDAIPTIPGPNGRLSGFPAEVLHAGTVPLTAVIHTQSAAHTRWDIRTAKADEAEKPTWPNESGGYATLEKIQARCRDMRKIRIHRRPG